MYSMLIYFFCVKCSGDHRDLHSFPTRRSSDLGPPRRAGGVGPVAGGEAGDQLRGASLRPVGEVADEDRAVPGRVLRPEDRKSTRLNSSHMSISYAVFCLKKKNMHDYNWRF